MARIPALLLLLLGGAAARNTPKHHHHKMNATSAVECIMKANRSAVVAAKRLAALREHGIIEHIGVGMTTPDGHAVMGVRLSERAQAIEQGLVLGALCVHFLSNLLRAACRAAAARLLWFRRYVDSGLCPLQTPAQTRQAPAY